MVAWAATKTAATGASAHALTGQLDAIAGKDAYRAYLGGFSQSTTGLTDIAAFGDDHHVVLFYCPHTAVTSTAPAAEPFTIRDGRIVQSLLVFDRLSYAPPQAQ